MPVSAAVPWVPRQRNHDGEVVSLLRELINDRREEKDRRREEEERRRKEEQSRIDKEEERKRLEEEEARQAEKEARITRIINSKMEELDRQHQARTEEENRKIWKEIERVVGEPSRSKHGKEPAMEEGENRMLSQQKIEGSPPSLPAQGKARITEPAWRGHLSSLVADLLLMEIDNVQRTQDTQFGIIRHPSSSKGRVDENTTPGGNRFSARLAGMFASVAGNAARRRSRSVSPARRAVVDEPLGFNRVIPGKKAAVASSGKDGRKKYFEDLKKELLTKTKYQLKSLCKADKIKYYNKKQASADLAEIRSRDAYGDDSDDEGLDNITSDTQEENPS
ncbi:hypothetical protein CBR_g27968 [Chara braunii]|uniref:Uncharacterized protein n=1 Tax=Chara braunii TaxID=69332 RepID=A0A388L8Y6_CHABU|nr:hypothetical protein CBR_g27968 [Chara braunii]|eukprot:GBG78744.1 hypothetical protein CBR_g27968 [Chara braunii]